MSSFECTPVIYSSMVGYKSDVNTPAFGPNKPYPAPGPSGANRRGRVGPFFQAQSDSAVDSINIFKVLLLCP